MRAEDVELKPCPFCGEVKRLVVAPGSAQNQTSVYCGRCGTLGPTSWGHEDNVPMAVELWNRATLSSTPDTQPFVFKSQALADAAAQAAEERKPFADALMKGKTSTPDTGEVVTEAMIEAGCAAEEPTFLAEDGVRMEAIYKAMRAARPASGGEVK